MSLDICRNLQPATEDRGIEGDGWVGCGVGGRENGGWVSMQRTFRLTYLGVDFTPVVC